MNAIEAMDSVTDRARLLRIRSEFIQESSEVLVTIEDSGTGIEGDKDRIFEPFFTTKSRGTGIGLTILSLDHRVPWRERSGICEQSLRDDFGSLCRAATFD